MEIQKHRAFISVTDKKGLEQWKSFTDSGHEIVSTGGTAKKLTELGIPSTKVETVTGFPEILDGRVKSMHPLITGAMLGDTSNPKHVAQMAQHGIVPFTIVVVNLYDFLGNPGIENIDVGGPTAIRSAAKNAGCVTVVTDPNDYHEVLYQIIINGDTTARYRHFLAVKAFEMTAKYDTAIQEWIRNSYYNDEDPFVKVAKTH